MPLTIPYPEIDPILFQIGPFALRWYSLAYIGGLIAAWRLCMALAKRPPRLIEPVHFDDFLVWATLGVILGGRLGYVIFYQPDYYLNHPGEIFMVWQGGMSFHGGFLGVALAAWLFVRRRGLSPLAFGDLLAIPAPIGLGLGRLANFINGELFGRISDAPWTMVFPNGGSVPRHPSQLYEATLEGPVLLALLCALVFFCRALERPGTVMGAFIAGYGLARIISEQFRQPDTQLGFLTAGTTMGQWLSLPMIGFGLWLIWRARKVN